MMSHSASCLPRILLLLLFLRPACSKQDYRWVHSPRLRQGDAVASANVMEGDNLCTTWNGRLLQTKTPCSINFEYQNYTIITSQCKGPSYPVKACCNALLKFACPFAAEINDRSNDCAENMFSYINIIGKYPPGLFANECTNGTAGLGIPCPATALTEIRTSDRSRAVQHKSSHEILWLAFLIINTVMSLSAM